MLAARAALAALCALLVVGSAAGGDVRRFVIRARASLRDAPRADGFVVEELRIGREVRVLGVDGGWSRVETPFAQGFVESGALTGRRPSLMSLAGRADAARTAAAERRWLERAVAFAPSDERLIERLVTVLEAEGDDDAAHRAHKGLIAAERRNLSWDGPLYPIDDGIALFPAPCDDGVTGSARAPGLKRPLKKTLRARAFSWVASGKVVAVGESGRHTVALDQPVCVESACGGRQAGYALARHVDAGALLPSWLVAGHAVVPFTPLSASPSSCARGRRFEGDAFVVERCDETRWRLSLRTLDGERALGWLEAPRAGAVPIAHLSEDERRASLLWRAPGTRACCPADVEVWLTRVSALDEPAPVVEDGRVFSSGFRAECAQERFLGLEGEPRCERLPEGCQLGEP